MTSDLAAPVPYSPNVRIDASCLMCGTSGTRLERDHCHIHGWVRGTLCRSCNSLMGHFDAQVPPLKQSRWAACIAHRHRCHQCTVVSIADVTAWHERRLQPRVIENFSDPRHSNPIPLSTAVPLEQVEEWRNRYADGATIYEIAATDGVTPDKVRRALPATRRTGPRGRTDITVQAVLDAIAEHGSRKAAASALGVSRTLVATRLRDAGLCADPHGDR